MSKKITIRVVLLLVGAFGVFVVYSVASLFIPRYGTVASVSDLQKVYNKVRGPIATASTNSLIQHFPFDGPIGWKIIFFKDPMVFLSGRVATNRLHQFISSHPDTRFLWSGAGNESEEGWPSSKDYPSTTWTNIWFKTDWVVEGYSAVIEGKIDLQSCVGTVQSWGGEPVNANK
jgi:hypothetical protein